MKILPAFLRKRSFLFKFRLFLGFVLLILTMIFLYLKVLPFGQITYSRNYGSWLKSGKGFIYGLTPAERIDLSGAPWPSLSGDPVYFSLFTPRTFDEATVTIKYQDHLSKKTPLIEMGVLVDKLVWRYNLKPLENKILEQLKFQWSRLEDGSRLILQSEKNYDRAADFMDDLSRGRLKNCPDGLQSCLAVYNYAPSWSYRLSNYQAASPLVIETPLRGAHQFFLYLNNESLHLDLEFVDLNQNPEADPILVVLSGEKGEIGRELLADTAGSGNGGLENKKISLVRPKLTAGVYRVEIKVNEDIVIKKINSSAGKLAFINRVWPVSTGGETRLYTDANYLQVKAMQPTARQTIKFAGEAFKILEPNEQFTFQTAANSHIKEIVLSKDEVILENSGVFSFREDSLFNPSLEKVDRFFSPSGGPQYIIADYQAPRGFSGPGEWKTASATFRLKGAYREKGKYSFMISVPGLRADDEIADYVMIKEIKIKLRGRTLWQKIFD